MDPLATRDHPKAARAGDGRGGKGVVGRTANADMRVSKIRLHTRFQRGEERSGVMNANEPASPTTDKCVPDSHGTIYFSGTTGLSKLELLSAMAMQGMLSNPACFDGVISQATPGLFAFRSVSMARALLAELERTEKK